MLRPFCRVTRRVDELYTAFSMLFKIYCKPLSDLGVLPNEDLKRKLFGHLQPHISKYLSARKPDSCGDIGVIDFHMSTSAKYLLISAFLASRNPPTLDASLFDSTGGSDGRKRKRK